MSSSGAPFSIKSDRTPLRNVQNELLGLQKQTPSNGLKPVLDEHHPHTQDENLPDHTAESALSAQLDSLQVQTTCVSSKHNAYQTNQTTNVLSGQGDITFKSIICSGGEIELPDDSIKSEESSQTGELMFESHLQSPCDVSEHCGEDTQALLSSSQHVDHPYSNFEGEASISPGKRTVSVVCVANSTQTATETTASSPSELQSVCCVASSASADAPEVCCQSDVSTDGIGDITFKSFSCSGVQVEITDASPTPDCSAHMNGVMAVSHLASFNDTSGNDGDSTEALQADGQHVDHGYCLYEREDASTSGHTSPGAVAMVTNTSGNISVSEASVQIFSLGDGCVTDTGAQPPPPQETVKSMVNQSSAEVLDDITLKSFTCSGVEVEVSDNTSVMSEAPVSIIVPAVGCQSPSMLNQSESILNVSEAFSPQGGHIDHPYCNFADSLNTENAFAMISAESEASEKAADFGPVVGGQTMPKSQVVSPIAETAMPFASKEMHFSANASVSRTGSDNDSRRISSSTHSQSLSPETSMAKDSAFGSSGDQHHSEAELLRCGTLSDEICEPLSVHSQVKLFGASSLSAPCTPKGSVLSRSALLELTERKLESRLWAELLESPMPPPQLNSTALGHSFSCTPPPTALPSKGREAPASVVPVSTAKPEGALGELPIMGEGPLQQQLRQMAELLMLASGRVGVITAPPPVECHSAAASTEPAQCHSACVWTTPVQRCERSVNTSAQVEVVKESPVSDASTSTDTLLWNLNPGTLEALSREELEQRLTSTLIMVEALFQQLASARGQSQGAGPAPSDLRDKLIQTDHTELSQMETYKDLYVAALERNQALEQDEESLQTLHHSMQAVRSTMTSMKADTEEALISMKEIGGIVSEDHESIARQAGQMKRLYGRCREALGKMEQKARDCLREREDMRQRMEEALQARDAAFSVAEQLRVHHASEVAELERSVGSHQELMAALSQAHPLQVELNKAYAESLGAANQLLKGKLDDHVTLFEELKKAQQLLQRTSPVLMQLHERASTATEQSQQHLAQRDHALEERAQMEEELNQAFANLQDASQQVGDLNMQLTIMNSEMTVLRQQLNEVEEERTQLQRKSTELSATVSSTLASYAFLEQALASETSKSQQSLKDAQQATDRSNELEVALEASRTQCEEQGEALAQREALVQELRAQTEAQTAQLRLLPQLRAELGGAREMCEFLQAENELSREQMSESEGLLRSYLQSLRERNLECEDLRLALDQLRLERESVQEELEGTRTTARTMLLEQGQQLAQASSDITLLHHRLRQLTSNLQGALSAKKPEPPSQPKSDPFQPQRHPSSFVDSVMVAITAEEPPAPEDTPPSDAELTESPSEGIGSGSSAFTRVAPVTPKKQEEERLCTVVELLGGLGQTLEELASTTQQLRQRGDHEQRALQQALADLQGELQTEAHRHRVEVSELTEQLAKLQAQVERDAVALQQKAQEEKTLRKLCSEMEESVDGAQKHKVQNDELRRELCQSQVEAQALREELRQTGSLSDTGAKAMEDRIRLLKEVEKLKGTLLESENSRAKLLDKAKRHQWIHTTNQSKLERELHLLDDMIEAVRKALSSIPDVVNDCAELQKLVEYLG